MERKSDHHVFFDILKLFGFLSVYVIISSCFQVAGIYVLGKQFSLHFFEELSAGESLFITILNTITISLLFLYKRKSFGLKRPTLVIRRSLLLRFILVGLISSLTVIILIAVLLAISRPYILKFNSDFSLLDFCLYFVLFIVAAFNEEVLCRAILLHYLLQRNSALLSLTITSSMFTFLHLGNPNFDVVSFVNIFFAGMLLGLLYIYSGKNLYLPVIFHAGWNFFQGPLLGFAVSGFNFRSTLFVVESPFHFSQMQFGLEGTLACTYVSLFVIAIFSFYLFFNKKKSIAGL